MPKSTPFVSSAKFEDGTQRTIGGRLGHSTLLIPCF